jgi:hypothetical protein
MVLYIINTVPHQALFWRRCRGGKRRLLQGEFLTHILYFVLSFALLYFYLHHFIKNTKKISFLLVVIFTCLALSCFLSMVGFFETKSFWQGGFTEEQ